MNTDLKNFIQPIVQAMAATLFVVFTVAFFSLPYALERYPGEPLSPSQQMAPRHMT